MSSSSRSCNKRALEVPGMMYRKFTPAHHNGPTLHRPIDELPPVEESQLPDIGKLRTVRGLERRNLTREKRKLGLHRS
jgi:hypothetical protein